MKPEPLTNGLLVDKKEKTLKIVSQRFWLDLKGRIEWLLKEIEKEKEFYYDYQEEQVALLNWVERLIKKAFKGVVER